MANYKRKQSGARGKQSKRNRNDKQSNRSENRTKSEQIRDEETSGKFNDPSWYTRASDLVLNAGNFSFNNAAGVPLLGIDDNPIAIPGIYALHYAMIPGIATAENSPINIAARAMYDKVNYKNSRNFSYDAPDLMMYVYGVSSVYALWSHLVRIYGVANTFSVTNRYVPEALLKAMGVSPTSIRRNMASLLYTINMLARQINALAVPADIPLFSRYMWLPSSIWADAQSMKAGLYLYVPEYFWTYYEKNATGTASYLQPSWWIDSSTRRPVERDIDFIQNMCDDLVNNLLNSQDINNMSSDVLKAYEGNIVQLPSIDSSYTVVPQFSVEVIQQLHNSIRVGTPTVDEVPKSGTWGTEHGLIHQDNDKSMIIYQFQSTETDSRKYPFQNPSAFVLDAISDAPTPEDVFVMTRLMPAGSGKVVHYAGSEVVTTNVIWNLDSAGIASYTDVPGYSNVLTSENSYGYALSVMRSLADMTHFDNAPLTMLSTNASTSSDDRRFNISGDVTNYTTISHNSLNKLHEAAMLSLFSVTDMFKK
jgi:hypothetical protein